MNTFTIIFIFLTATKSQTNPDTTLPLRDRIALLKHKITQEIENKQKSHGKVQNDVSESFENVEYVDLEKEPITPINENDERKKHGRFHLRRIRTTTERTTAKRTTKPQRFIERSIAKKLKRTTADVTNSYTDLATASLSPIVAEDLKSSKEEHKYSLQGIDNIFDSNTKPQNLRHKKPLHLKEIAKPRNIFYRRIYNIDLNKRCTKEIIHCTDLLTPILTGQKINITERKILSFKDQEVRRLLELLHDDSASLPKDEVYAHLYQISNLQIRLFQWDVISIRMLFNVINKRHQRRHTWKSLKSGIKQILRDWHLDYTNVTSLLLQAKVFRPPCIADDFTGSTQSPRISHYTSRRVKLKKCTDKDELDSSSCEMR